MFLIIFKSLLLKQIKAIFLEAGSPTLSKQRTRDADPKAIQQVNFTANLDQEAKMIFIIIRSKLNSFLKGLL